MGRDIPPTSSPAASCTAPRPCHKPRRSRMKVLGMEFRSDAENARVAGLVARTSVVRNSGILVCTRSEKAWLELGRGIEKPLSTRALGWLLEIAADKGSQEIREVAPDLGKRDARLHFMSASGFL